MDIFERAEKKHPVSNLQLAPVIDVFIIIIIFFIMGSFTNGVAVEVPVGLKLPWSFLVEQSEIGPEVQVFGNRIVFKFISAEREISEMGSASLTWFETLMKVKDFVARMDASKGSKKVNLVISEEIPYSVIYDLSQHLRSAGFEDLSYVTERERSQKQ